MALYFWYLWEISGNARLQSTQRRRLPTKQDFLQGEIGQVCAIVILLSSKFREIRFHGGGIGEDWGQVAAELTEAHEARARDFTTFRRRSFISIANLISPVRKVNRLAALILTTCSSREVKLALLTGADPDPIFLNNPSGLCCKYASDRHHQPKYLQFAVSFSSYSSSRPNATQKWHTHTHTYDVTPTVYALRAVVFNSYLGSCPTLNVSVFFLATILN